MSAFTKTFAGENKVQIIGTGNSMFPAAICKVSGLAMLGMAAGALVTGIGAPLVPVLAGVGAGSYAVGVAGQAGHTQTVAGGTTRTIVGPGGKHKTVKGGQKVTGMGAFLGRAGAFTNPFKFSP